MAKLRGTGIAAVNYPTGMNLGGDPSQALIHATTSGTFVVVALEHRPGPGAADGHRPDLRRGSGRAALTMSYIDTADTDTGPHCMGTFASRATHRVGNAVIAAAVEAREGHARRGRRWSWKRARDDAGVRRPGPHPR